MSGNTVLQGRARLPGPSPLPREIIEQQAIEATETIEPPPEVRRDSGTIMANPGRFPRTAIVLEMAAVADRLRIAARAIDHLCAHAIDYEPTTLRRKAHALVRMAWADVAGRVTL